MAKIAYKPIAFYRGLKADLPTLKAGEPGWCTDTKQLYVGDGITNHLMGYEIVAAVMEGLFDANTILKADTDNTPAALTIEEQKLIGRITDGQIAGLTATQVRTLLNIEDGADALPVADTVAIAKGSVDETKQVRFEVDGLTTETTRVITVPDKDLTPAEAGINSDITSMTGLDDDGIPYAKIYGAGNMYFPDYNEADQGVTGNGKSAKAYIDAIAAKKATLVFRHNSGATTTTYTFSTDETIPSNIDVVIEKGAILSIGSAKTLTINSSFSVGRYQVFSGDGSVNFGFGVEAYPEWWGALIDGTTNDTTAIQKAIDAAILCSGAVAFPCGTTVQEACTIDGDIKIYGHRQGSTIKRPTNFDDDDVSGKTAGQAHFDITEPNISVSISKLTFDGNESNQNAVDPRATSIRLCDTVGAITGSSQLHVSDCNFINQTYHSISIYGGTSTNEMQYLIVENCSFLDGRKGIGQGDPASGNVNGFDPCAISCCDHVTAIIKNNKFIYRKALADLAEYAPSGVHLTVYSGTVNADGASGIIEGNAFYRYGRKSQDYQGNANNNNGLGCIDFYARGREVVIADNKFDNCFNTGVRGKTNCDTMSITGNIINDTPMAINIVPATSDTQTGNIVIANNVIHNSDYIGIAVIGNYEITPAYVANVSIIGNVLDSITDADEVGNGAGIYVRAIQNATIIGNSILDASAAAVHGIYCRLIEDINISANTIRNSGSRGIYINSVDEQYLINGNIIVDSGGNAIKIEGSEADTDGVISNNIIQTAVDYGIYNQTSIGDYVVTGNVVRGITGASRGIYVPATVAQAIIANNISNATNPSINANIDAVVKEFLNSWNQGHKYRSAAPTTGTWGVGDIIQNTIPSAGGNIGWVCVTAGTPGTWKTFGTIEN